MGDIGKLFPDNDEKFEGIDSIKILRKVVCLLHEEGFNVVNIDSTIVAQKPKMSSYTEQMRQNIALACNIDVSCISVKATTEEGLGFTGEGKAIAAHAVVLIQ